MKAKLLFPEEYKWTSEIAQSLWMAMSTAEPFDSTISLPDINRSLPRDIKEASSLVHETQEILPIQAFKSTPEAIGPKERFDYFLSSGTTALNRSKSYFSMDGIELYRRASMATFFSVLEEFFPQPLRVKGYSLIPGRDIWTNSSLAQMMDWIAEFVHVSRNLKHDLDDSTPTWIFGTGFHFVELFESGFCMPLPKGSVVIETGGTKGKTRDVNRTELHNMIQKVFRIPKSHIISEYGMCEIACQAYEWSKGSSEPKFRFPSWVDIGVQNHLGVLKPKGFGTLIIDDPLRIDYPWPLRTQDLVTINKQSFTLEGRVPGSVLKGCSLNAESLLNETQASYSNQAVSSHLKSTPKTKFLSKLKIFLSNPLVLNSLEREFESPTIAKWALKDLLDSLPDTEVEFSNMLNQVSPPINKKSWLFILPQTHSIAGLYPLFLAAALDLKITVRKRRSWTILEEEFVLFLRAEGTEVETQSSDLRLTKGELPWDAIFAFGEDDTINLIDKLSSIPVKGFGSLITGTVIADKIESHEWALVQKDLLSLGNLGCMSSRVLFFVSDQNPQTLQHEISENYSKNCLPALTPKLRIGAHHSLYEEYKPSIAFTKNSDGTNFIWHQFNPHSSLQDYLCNHQFCYGAVQVSTKQFKLFCAWLSEQPGIRISTHVKIDADVITVPLGTSNISPWDGKHMARPLFQINGVER